MKLALALLLSMLLSGAAFAQDATKSRATIEGLVTRDPDSQPVKKALIELIADNQAQGGNYTTLTGPDGAFRIENITPGRYHLFAERTGFLDTDKQRGRSDGRILTLTAGQELKDLQLRLQAAAIIRGRVTDEDGDPLPNAEVTALHQTFIAGHKHWEQAGAERTNDLGEYRIANLPAGNDISVSPPPDFKSLIENAGTADARNAEGDSVGVNDVSNHVLPRHCRSQPGYADSVASRRRIPRELYVDSESEFKHPWIGGECAAACVRDDHAAVA